MKAFEPEPEPKQRPLPPALLQEPVECSQRQQDGQLNIHSGHDWIANEVPIALAFNGIAHAVMMATPQDLEDFALGFALSEGIINLPAECYGIEVHAIDSVQAVQSTQAHALPIAAIALHTEIASSAAARLKMRRRVMAGNTGCGICGIESLHMLDLNPSPVAAPGWVQALDAGPILRAFAQLQALQPLNALAGSLHAAAWALPDGQLLEVREDIGRHNALDKLLGHCSKNGWIGGPSSPDGFVILSSRASYELVRKCARLGIPALATVSAPTALALEIARQAGIRLWGWSRGGRAVAYC